MTEETDKNDTSQNESKGENDDTILEEDETQPEQTLSDEALSLKEELDKIKVEPPQLKMLVRLL